MPQPSDQQQINDTHNLARFFTENRAISWVLLIAVVFWGYVGYNDMPKRKDPNIPINLASVVTPWPGKTAQQVEQLITYPIEQAIAENTTIRPLSTRDWGLKSTSLPDVSIIQVRLSDNVSSKEKLQQFNDINLKLQNLNASLPPGAGPITLNNGFSDTASLLLEVVSPKENDIALSLRARDIRQAITRIRGNNPTAHRVALIFAFPRSINTQQIERLQTLFLHDLQQQHPDWLIKDFHGAGFIGLDLPAQAGADDTQVKKLSEHFLQQHFGLQQFHPDMWEAAVIRNPENSFQQLKKIAGDKYSYREMDDFSDMIARNLDRVSQVSKVDRSGVLAEQIYLAYSQQQLAEYGIQPEQIKNALNDQNVAYSGGSMQVQGVAVNIQPSGQFKQAQEIGNVVIGKDDAQLPVYLRSVAEIHRGYQYPPRFLTYYSAQNKQTRQWQRNKAISIAVFMRDGEQLGEFGSAVNKVISRVQSQLPDDLQLVKISDQAQQAADSIDLFATALYEAIIMVVLVAMLGFREWRSALVMLIAIPLTMAMTFGMINMLDIDVQQVSIVGLIIALGLLVDDPVVASDAIKRNLQMGHTPLIAAWLGPTKLASAIMYATITNIAAYLPLLLVTGDIGHFLYSLPIVMTCALIASRIVSMTFIPLLGYYLIRPDQHQGTDINALRTQGFSGFYYRIGTYAIAHRKKVLTLSLLVLVAGGILKSQLVNSFFPYDVQHLCYVDVWLRNDANLQDTGATTQKAVQVIQQVSEQYARQHSDKNTPAGEFLESITINLGGSGPKFWFSVLNQLNQQNYAQLIIRVKDKDATAELIKLWQQALSAQVPGAMINVNQLQTQPVAYPVAIRISSQAALDGPKTADDIKTLRKLAEQLKTMLRKITIAERINDDWGADNFNIQLDIEADLANLAGVTNADVAYSSALAVNGVEMTQMRVGDKQIPVVTTLSLQQRAQLSDLNDLYVYARDSEVKVPILDVASMQHGMQTSKIVRLGQFRTITVYAYPVPGSFPSQIMKQLRQPLQDFRNSLPAGYEMEITGVEANANNGTGQLIKVLLICIACIYIALVVQFRNAVKPLLVFAAVPYGVCGAFAGLFIMHSTFGFMAFLGIVALIGVIVSHIIVLFDFVEDARQHGESLHESLLDAGIFRLRPVLITVAATIMALLPLAIHGGPLWQPLCYAQIGGLAFATVVTLILVPVMYAFFVLDLKIVKWQQV